MKNLITLLIIIVVSACHGQQRPGPNKLKVVKTDAQWKNDLTAGQYKILRQKGTEAPFTGEFDRHFEKGYYACAGCNAKLFESQTKFKSDCGWPSFDKAIKGSVIYQADNSHNMTRTEVLCSSCGGHLGHVFDDGPTQTTGQRYCINSTAMMFIAQKKP